MAEQLKRWNGTAWVNVVSVNRLEVSGGDGGDPMQKSTMLTTLLPDSPIGGWTLITMVSTSTIAVF